MASDGWAVSSPWGAGVTLSCSRAICVGDGRQWVGTGLRLPCMKAWKLLVSEDGSQALLSLLNEPEVALSGGEGRR